MTEGDGGEYRRPLDRGSGPRENPVKNSRVLAEVIWKARERGANSGTLETMVQRIAALRAPGEPAPVAASEEGPPSAVPVAVADYEITPSTVTPDAPQPGVQ